MKRFFFLITLLSMSSIQTGSAHVQVSADFDDAAEIMEQSKFFIDQAKKRGLSDLQIIENLDAVLAQAALTDGGRAIQGKGANLTRLLWAAGGAVTTLTIAGIIFYIWHHLEEQAKAEQIEKEKEALKIGNQKKAEETKEIKNAPTPAGQNTQVAQGQTQQNATRTVVGNQGDLTVTAQGSGLNVTVRVQPQQPTTNPAQQANPVQQNVVAVQNPPVHVPAQNQAPVQEQNAAPVVPVRNEEPVQVAVAEPQQDLQPVEQNEAAQPANIPVVQEQPIVVQQQNEEVPVNQIELAQQNNIPVVQPEQEAAQIQQPVVNRQPHVVVDQPRRHSPRLAAQERLDYRALNRGNR